MILCASSSCVIEILERAWREGVRDARTYVQANSKSRSARISITIMQCRKWGDAKVGGGGGYAGVRREAAKRTEGP